MVQLIWCDSAIGAYGAKISQSICGIHELAHKKLEHLLVIPIDLARSMIVLLRYSATPFCWSVRGIVS